MSACYKQEGSCGVTCSCVQHTCLVSCNEVWMSSCFASKLSLALHLLETSTIPLFGACPLHAICCVHMRVCVWQIVQGIKALKLYAWEHPFTARAEALRNKELFYVGASALAEASNAVVFWGVGALPHQRSHLPA